MNDLRKNSESNELTEEEKKIIGTFPTIRQSYAVVSVIVLSVIVLGLAAIFIWGT